MLYNTYYKKLGVIYIKLNIEKIINNRIKKIENPKYKYTLGTKYIYNIIWRQIIKNIDFEKLQLMFLQDGIVIKKYEKYDPCKDRYNYQIKYTLSEFKKIINNKDNNYIESLNNEEKHIHNKKKIKKVSIKKKI